MEGESEKALSGKPDAGRVEWHVDVEGRADARRAFHPDPSLAGEGQEEQWEGLQWDSARKGKSRLERFPLVRPVWYEISRPTGEGSVPIGRGMALTVNVSNGGLCVIMNRAPAPDNVLRVEVPMPIPGVKTPTLAEVRWLRSFALDWDTVYLVGMRFML